MWWRKKERELPAGDVLEPVQKPHEGPGEMGKPVVIPKEDQEKMKQMFKISQFNLMASEMIALNRSLPDVRFSSVLSLVMSDSLQSHESQQAKPPCPSQTPGVYWNTCPSSWWCHPAISSWHPLLLLPPIPPSIRIFSNESALRMRWPKYWSFSFSISPSNEHPGLISFWMD